MNILRAICPPLKAPGPGEPPFEVRGPLIVVEGDQPLMLKEVTAVIQKALSISGECAVRTWTAAGEDEADRDAAAEGGAGPRLPSDNTIASYMDRMLQWHKKSEALVRYMTTHPSKTSSASSSSSATDTSTATKPSNEPVAKDTEAAVAKEDSSSSTATRQAPHQPNAPLLPVAVVSDGYSLTAADKWAGALPINGAYRADDHWQWVATLWRGIVGADLTVYVQRVPAEEGTGTGAGTTSSGGSEEQTNSNNCVEFANADHSVLVLRMADDGQGGGGMDEKLERRLGFEIMEWVRSGGFKAAVASGAGAGAEAGDVSSSSSSTATAGAAMKRPWTSMSA